MNNNKQISMALAIVSILALSAPLNASFMDTVASIKNNLFKLSPDELCATLSIARITIPVISAEQLKEELCSTKNILLVNVLSERYYNDCHIVGSINVPLPELVDRAAAWDHSQKIVVYCALDECDAGEKGCILLNCMNFTNVSDYKGGIKEWFQLNYPTEGPALSEYLHTKKLPSIDLEYTLYPESIVCSRQTCWGNRYQK